MARVVAGLASTWPRNAVRGGAQTLTDDRAILPLPAEVLS